MAYGDVGIFLQCLFVSVNNQFILSLMFFKQFTMQQHHSLNFNSVVPDNQVEMTEKHKGHFRVTPAI